MLISIRNKTKGWVAWLFVIIIGVTFSLFGISAFFEGNNQPVIANVDGTKIYAQAFENTMEQRRRTFRRQLGNNFDPAMVDNPAFRRQVVEGLVSNQLVRDYGQDRGLRLSDQALSDRITASPQFQIDGKFDSETYRRAVSARGYSVEGFEQQERLTGGLAQLQAGLQTSSLFSPAELDQLLAINLQQRDADYTVIKAKDYIEGIEIEAAAKQVEYDENKDLYQQADRVKLDYVLLTVADLSKDIELDDDEITQAFEASKGKYTNPETRIASHILLSVPRAADEEKDAEVLKSAKAVYDRAIAGEAFDELAEEFSDDPGSKRKGGDLGIIAKGQMVAPFEAAVFSMQQDEISEPVKSEFGYHIIKLTSLKAESQKPLEEVKDQVIKEEKTRLAQSQFTDAAETFRALVFENPESLDVVAEDLGLSVQTSNWVSRASGAAPFSNARARNAAFSADVLEEALNSEVIQIDKDTLLALRKNTFEAQHTKAFSEVEAAIEGKLKNSKAAALAQTRGAELIEEVKLDTFSDAVVFNALPALKSKATSAVDRQVADEVFKQKLTLGEPITQGVALSNGDYAVYRLRSITEGKAEDASEEEREQLLRQLEGRDGNSAFSFFQTALRENAKVEIFSSLIEDDEDTAPAAQ